MKKKTGKIAVSLALFLLGAALIWAGVFRGEAQTVLEKGIRICVECMGLG